MPGFLGREKRSVEEVMLAAAELCIRSEDFDISNASVDGSHGTSSVR